jgi:eukaryotic-like serine/threonine-protein kinase
MSFEGMHLDHYRLLHLLRNDEFDEIYLAEDICQTQQVAIKVVPADLDAHSNVFSREMIPHLLQEMRAVRLLDHPHILPLLDFGEARLDGNNIFYVVMPYWPKESLADWLQRQGGRLSPQQAFHVVSQAADALFHAHEQDIIHQDVKPSNFLLVSRSSNSSLEAPDLLLTSFGISGTTRIGDANGRVVRGTPTYMAPEQWIGRPVVASDQYALGIIAYQLLTGQEPFQGSTEEMMWQHLHIQPVLPSSLNPLLNPALDAVILRAVAKKAAKRFASIREFARAFQQALNYAGDLHVTISITPKEARTGSIQLVHMPGNWWVNVWVMAGIQSGQVIRLDTLGEPYYEGGPTGTVFLTVNIS